MGNYESLKIMGYDHVELAVANLEKASEVFVRLGFERIGAREVRERKLRSVLLSQNHTTVLLSQSSLATDPVAKYVAAHGDGVFSIAFLCEDAVSCLEHVINRGARVADQPKSISRDFGTAHRASIGTLTDLRIVFVSRQGALFGEGFEVPIRQQPRGFGIEQVDHLGLCVDAGQLDTWSDFYEQILGLKVDKRDSPWERQLHSADDLVHFHLSDPGEPSGRCAEFLDVHHGSGVQHIAFSSRNLLDTLRPMHGNKVPFRTASESGPASVDPGIQASRQAPEVTVISADGSLRAFTANPAGTLYLEFVERKQAEPGTCASPP